MSGIASKSGAAFAYRFIYFDVRGAGELCRLLLTVSDADWTDVRYPMSVSEKGFSYGPEFRRDAHHYSCNFHQLPVLQVVDQERPHVAIATIGQSHTIARFISGQHGNLSGSDDVEMAKVDSIYESCRDIKSAWYKAKRHAGGKKTWFENAPNAVDVPSPDSTPATLQDYCLLLEKALESYHPTRKADDTNSSWCMGGPQPTLADVAIYHLLATPTSPISGSTASFFDGQPSHVVQQAYQTDCPRLTACVQAMGNLEKIQEWEAKRPDTFT